MIFAKYNFSNSNYSSNWKNFEGGKTRNLNDRDKKKLLGIRPTDQTELIEDPKLVPLDLDVSIDFT